MQHTTLLPTERHLGADFGNTLSATTVYFPGKFCSVFVLLVLLHSSVDLCSTLNLEFSTLGFEQTALECYLLVHWLVHRLLHSGVIYWYTVRRAVTSLGNSRALQLKHLTLLTFLLTHQISTVIQLDHWPAPTLYLLTTYPPQLFTVLDVQFCPLVWYGMDCNST